MEAGLPANAQAIALGHHVHMPTAARFSYSPAVAPQDFGALIQSSFRLWLAGLRPTFRDALLASILSQLPWLPWWWTTRAHFSSADWQAWLDPAIWHTSIPVLCFDAMVTLASLYFFLVLLHRQGLIARGATLAQGNLVHVVRRLPAALFGTLSYCLCLLVALAPVGVALLLGWNSEQPLLLPLALVVGLLLAAAPLAWLSIAAAFVYPPILLDAQDGLAAQRLSFVLVRGNWTRCAGVLTLATLISSGLLGTIGALPFALTGAMAMLQDGWPALLRPGWLVFGQLLSTPLMALFLPLASASYMVCYEDLKVRRFGAFTTG